MFNGFDGPHSVIPTRSFSRRELARIGGLGLFGLSFNDLSGAAAPSAPIGGSFGRAKACVLLFIWGGPAHQDTWDLKPDAPREVRGEFRSIPANVPGIRVCEHFPLLAPRTTDQRSQRPHSDALGLSDRFFKIQVDS